ncbi:MAG: zinc-dependent alcohol dehydrogenase family protein [Chloroflexi bacterium]|nr:zinc-dependent alcohol dehydrogenase family protein [Chloroflexota bacterium]
MRAMQFARPAPIEENPLKETRLPAPAPGPGQALLEVRACGVCRTDLHIVEGDVSAPRLPLTPGHQVVGVVKALGAGAAGLQPGQRVGVPWLYAACGQCEHCRAGRENLCEQARFTGLDADGGFAEILLAEADFVLPLPDSFSDEQAAPLLCAGVIGYRALRLAEVQPGERVGLYGFGASAHLALQVAHHWGCEAAVFTRAAAHRRHAEELGAVWVGAAEDAPPWPLDRSVIFAPAGGLVPQALARLRPGGTLAVNAIHMSDIPAMPYRLLYGERTLRSVTNLTRRDGREFLALAAEIPLQPRVTLYPLEEANRALQDLKYSRVIGEAVLVMGGKT